jgi:hypothetical protein
MNNLPNIIKPTFPFLYQNAHVVGCVLGLFPLFLFYSGLIGKSWPFAVIGFYGIGWVMGRKWTKNDESVALPDTQKQSFRLLDILDSTIEKAEFRISGEARGVLNSIKNCVTELAPRLEAAPSLTHELKILERLVNRYLPITLENFLRLPSDYAISQSLGPSGQTATMLLHEQLVILDNQLKKMLMNTVADDARAVIENGRFLEEKFKSYDFFNLQ